MSESTAQVAPAMRDLQKANQYWIEPELITIIGLDTPDGADHPLYDERAFNAPVPAMVQNIMAIGVQVAVKVRKVGAYLLAVDGRQRTINARAANVALAARGEPTIKVKIEVVDGDDGTVEGVAIALNAHRQDDHLLVKAAKAARYNLRAGLEAAALAFGVTENTIKTWIKLDSLEGKVKNAVRDGKASVQAVVGLAGKDKAGQLEGLAKLLESAPKTASGRVTGNAARGARGASVAPGTKVLRRVLEKSETIQASDDFARGVRFALGELESSAWPVGLAEAAAPPPPKPRGRPRKVATEAAPEVPPVPESKGTALENMSA